MRFLESRHLSAFLNAFEMSLPRVERQQKDKKRHNQISEIICGILKIPELTFFWNMSEGLNVLDSDIAAILFFNNSPFFDRLHFVPIPAEGYQGYCQLFASSINMKHTKLIEYTRLKDGKLYLKNNVKELPMYPTAHEFFPNGLSIHGQALNVTLDESHV